MKRFPGEISEALWSEYLETLDAIEEITLEVVPRAEELDLDPSSDPFLTELRHVPKERRKEVATRIRAALSDGSHEGLTLSTVREVLDDLEREFENELWIIHLQLALFRARGRQRRAAVMCRSLLPSLVGSFEVLLSALLKALYQIHPGSIADTAREKSFSLEDLSGLGSVDDARELLISQKVDAFLRESFSTWSKTWKKQFQFSFEDLCLDWDSLIEIVERRHIIVHNGAMVSTLYKARTPAPFSDAPIGAVLEVEAEYLKAAISQLRVLGLLLASKTIMKLYPQGSEISVGKLHHVQYECLTSGDWDAGLKIGEISTDLDTHEDDTLLFRINSWLCQKRLGRLMSDDLEAFDTTVLQAKYRLAIAALLDVQEDAIKWLEKAFNAGELDLRALFEWPILDELRASSAFRQFLFREYSNAREKHPEQALRYSEVAIPPLGSRFHLDKCRHCAEGSIFGATIDCACHEARPLWFVQALTFSPAVSTDEPSSRGLCASPPPTRSVVHGPAATLTTRRCGSYVTRTPSSRYTSALSFGSAVRSTEAVSLSDNTSLRICSLVMLSPGTVAPSSCSACKRSPCTSEIQDAARATSTSSRSSS